jgi:hypothetical protein
MESGEIVYSRGLSVRTKEEYEEGIKNLKEPIEVWVNGPAKRD